jgi:hypothetical protein
MPINSNSEEKVYEKEETEELQEELRRRVKIDLEVFTKFHINSSRNG